MNREILYTVIESSIKRAINFVDKNPYSATYGFADRAFWSWRTKDFNNGSLQSLIYSFASIKTKFEYKEIYKNLNKVFQVFISAYSHASKQYFLKFLWPQVSF